MRETAGVVRRHCSRIPEPTARSYPGTGVVGTELADEDRGMTTLSYASGTSVTPLLGETIAANLERVARTHAEREALVDVASGRRWTYARAGCGCR